MYRVAAGKCSRDIQRELFETIGLSLEPLVEVAFIVAVAALFMLTLST